MQDRENLVLQVLQYLKKKKKQKIQNISSAHFYNITEVQWVLPK